MQAPSYGESQPYAGNMPQNPSYGNTAQQSLQPGNYASTSQTPSYGQVGTNTNTNMAQRPYDDSAQQSYGNPGANQTYGSGTQNAPYDNTGVATQSGGYNASNANANTMQSGAYHGANENGEGNSQGATMQGQRTGAAGKGPDAICKILDKLEHKFGGARFNDPNNDAKNLAMNQNLSKRIKTIAPMVMQKLPQILMMVKGQL